jgi:uncharacterized protein (DUF1800 family)
VLACVSVAALTLGACGQPSTQASTAPAPNTTMRGAGMNATSHDGRAISSRELATHVLDRLAFGPRPGDVDRVMAMGVDKWIDEQLEPSRIADAPTEQLLAALETQRKTNVELLADHPDPQEVQQRINQMRANGSGVVPTAADSQLLRRTQQHAAQLTSEIVAAPLVRAVSSERQLQEVMTDFWENHFSVYLPKSPNRYAMATYDRDVIRPHALGKFRDLLESVAKSPEMLFYLDNWQSAVDSMHPTLDEYAIESRRQASSDPDVRSLAHLPQRRGGRGVNENYGRELMELHTLGVDAGYTQKDVQEVSRALTGWSIVAPQLGGGFVFRPELHDAGEKIVLGHVLPAGRGIEDGEDVLDIIAKHPATARFITTKLARHFIADDPPADVVDKCAATFTRTGGDIRETLRCIVRSPEFTSRANFRAKVKTPFELVASALRALGAPADTTGRSVALVSQLGQPMYGHLTPEGWPDRGDAWMNSGAILNRINFGLRLAAGQVPGVRLANWAPSVRLRQQPPAAQVVGVIEELLGGDVSADTRRILMTGENPVLTNASSASNASNASNVPNKPAPQLTGLAAIVGLALGSPEFQRR